MTITLDTDEKWQDWANGVTALLNVINLKFDAITQLITAEGSTVMATVQEVAAEVTNETTVEGGAVKLLQQLYAMLKAAQQSGDPAALDAVLAAIKSNEAVLAAAVAAVPLAPDAPAPDAPAPAPAAARHHR